MASPDIGPGRRSVFVLLVVAGALLGGCATPESVRYEPVLKREFVPRKAPAAIARTTEAALTAQDHIKLGTVHVSYDDQVCEGAGCRKVAHSDTLEMRIRTEAARRGGDVLLLTTENAASSSLSYRAGRCLQQTSRTETATVSVPYCRSNPSIIGGCETAYRSETRRRTVTECIRHEQIPVTTVTLTSAGLVFRRDPELLARERAWREVLKRGSRDEVERMIAQGAPVNEPFLNDDVPRGVAGLAGNFPAIQALFVHGARMTPADLVRAAHNGHVEMAEFFLAHGAKPGEPDSRGVTPLHVAVSRNHLAVARLLLERGAPLDAVMRSDESRLSLLYWAVRSDKTGPEMVTLLLDYGAEIDRGSYLPAEKSGETPLMAAAFWGYLDKARVLVARGARTDARNQNHHTALHVAALGGQPAMIRWLVGIGLDIEARNKGGLTPLMVAAFAGSVESVRTLLALGADRTARSDDGRTAAEFVRGRFGTAKLDVGKKAEYRAVLKVLGN